MGIRVSPVAFFLLCLTSESLQGGLPRLPPNLGKGYSPSSGLGTAFGGDAKPQKSGSLTQNGYGTGVGGGMEPPKPGFGGKVKPQKSGYGPGLGAGAFPGVGGAQPAPAPQNGYGPGTGEGMKAPKPGPPAQNGHGPGTGEGMKPPKPGFSNGNGIGAGAFPEIGAQPGFGEGRKPQKPGYGNGNGLDALPGYGPELKAQKLGLWNGRGLGIQLGYRNGLGPRAFQGQGPQPGYNNGNGMAAQPGPCHRGLSPAKFLPRPPTTVPSAKGGGWSLKSQLPPPVQNAPTPAIQWGPKPQKAGYQPFNGYGAGAKLGFRGGLKLQKVGFHYGNEAVDAGILPETLQPGFPRANGFRNGLREETLLYPKATVPALERHGQAGAFQPWGAGMKPGYGYAGLGIQAGPYGQLKPEQLKHLGDPEVKTYTNSQLGNGYRGHCPSGKC